MDSRSAPDRRLWRSFALLICAAWLSMTAASAAASPATIVELRIQPDMDLQRDPPIYEIELMKLALKLGAEPGANIEYRLVPSKLPVMQELRMVQQVARGEMLDILMVSTTPEREKILLPVRIPIFKGLLGWRIGLVRSASAERFAEVRTLKDLRNIRMAQRHDWPDLQVLRANGIPTEAAADKPGLIGMLARSRFDYFPRGVYEVWDEQQTFAASGVVVEPHLLLHYTYPSYFFVNRDNTQLAETLRRGLERAIADGSFDRLFLQYFGETLKRLHMNERNVIELTNPWLSPETPVGRPELWYDPKKGR